MNEAEILEAIRVPQPDGLKITRGFRVQAITRNPERGSMHNDWWRFGVKHVVHQWLLENVGEQSSMIEWETRESNKGFWIHTGTQMKAVPRDSEGKSLIPHNSQVQLMSMWFDDKDTAMIFKLVWAGRL